jgi:hypothetical protein
MLSPQVNDMEGQSHNLKCILLLQKGVAVGAYQTDVDNVRGPQR